MQAKPSFFAELKRRNVYKIGAMYAVGGWLLVQVVTQVLPVFDVTALVQRIIVLAIVAGFPVALVLSWIYELTPQGIVRTDDVAPDASITARTGHQLNRAIIAGLSLAVLVLLAKVLWPYAHSGAAAPAAVNDKSIAVLPFANLSRDPDNAFFADGMQDEILTRLAQIGALRVVSRTSTQRYASAPDNVAEIARQLGVSNILEGSVQKSGNAVHINVQLIGAAADAHLWAQSYNRKLDDMFGVEGEVAQAVAEALNAPLSATEQQALSAQPTSDPEAYQAFLRARAADNNSYSLVAMQQAADTLAEAVRRDPQFTMAWAELAYDLSGLYFDGLKPQRDTAAAVREAAQTALRLDPQSGAALMAHGYYLYRVERDYTGALEDFRLALDKLPNNAELLRGMFLVERRLGRWDQAIAHMRLAIQRDPRNVSLLSPLGCEGLNYLRRFDEAAAVLQQALQVTPDESAVLACLALIEQQRGRLDAAQAWLAKSRFDEQDLSGQQHLQQALYRRDYRGAAQLVEQQLPQDDSQLSGIDVQNMVGFGYALKWGGDAAGARAVFERVARVLLSSPDVMEHAEIAGHHLLALAYAGLGHKDQAIEAARVGVELNANDAIKLALAQIAQAQVYAQFGERDAAIAVLPHLLEAPASLTPPLLAFDPMWDPLRGDPRFRKLAAGSPL